MSVTAYVDESGCTDCNVYLLAAVIFTEEQAASARPILSDLYAGKRKLHWHNENTSRRDTIIRTISDFDQISVIVVAHRVGRRIERGRRKCLEALFPELVSLGVHHAVFESRAAGDQRDLRLIETWRGMRVIPRQLRVEFALPHGSDPEVLLWSADAVCGAVLASVRGDSAYLDVIKDHVHRIELLLD